MEIKHYNPLDQNWTKYLFFTGKGGVGKTSTAAATAIAQARSGKRVLLLSTDPASNLQDVFEQPLDNKGTKIESVPGLTVINLDPIEAAEEYKQSVVGPYRGKLPESVIANMEEQLSGSCTVEIASFNEFSKFITDPDIENNYDSVIFDTAPTGHTLRMLQLPSAWDSFIDTSTHGASCLGQLSGLDEHREMYKQAVKMLGDENLTTLILVARPDKASLTEAARASEELGQIGIENQMLVLNGLLPHVDSGDMLAGEFAQRQNRALKQIPEALRKMPSRSIELHSFNLSGIESLGRMFGPEEESSETVELAHLESKQMKDLIDDLVRSGKKVVFTMGKGGVGKTTIAARIARELAGRGRAVVLATTDPAGHLAKEAFRDPGIEIRNISEAEELAKYREEVVGKAVAGGASQEDIDYIEEDLRSPCTQEIAVFRAFADIVDEAQEKVVVIDTAPTGHTLLLLNSTESYHHEMERSKADIPESVTRLLPRLRNAEETEVVIVTLPEATPFYEADRLKEDLERAEIAQKWWVINASLLAAEPEDKFLKSRAAGEERWIRQIEKTAGGNAVLVPWTA